MGELNPNAPYGRIKKAHWPVLFVHGSNDTLREKGMEMLFSDANDSKKKIIIEGNDHGQEPNREACYTEVVAWCKKWLA